MEEYLAREKQRHPHLTTREQRISSHPATGSLHIQYLTCYHRLGLHDFAQQLSPVLSNSKQIIFIVFLKEAGLFHSLLDPAGLRVPKFAFRPVVRS